MKTTVLKTRKLTKRYGKKLALDQVDMEINQGEIYGFIGSNGAGKSTLMRLISGLTTATSGQIELFGYQEGEQLNRTRRRIGSLIENPGFFPYLNAKQNLEVIRLQRGIPDKNVSRNVLEMVGLADTGRKKVKNFSLGMKQRLGLAMALIANPEFLILDEPTNGLDPKGVIEIRNLLKTLNEEQGTTILISSHILSEVHQLATRIGIIHQGKVVEQITAKELDEKSKAYLLIKTNEITKAAAVLEAEAGTTHFEVMPDDTIHLYDHLNDSQMISRILFENGLIIERMSLKNETLEDYFSSVTEEGGSQ